MVDHPFTVNGGEIKNEDSSVKWDVAGVGRELATMDHLSLEEALTWCQRLHDAGGGQISATMARKLVTAMLGYRKWKHILTLVDLQGRISNLRRTPDNSIVKMIADARAAQKTRARLNGKSRVATNAVDRKPSSV